MKRHISDAKLSSAVNMFMASKHFSDVHKGDTTHFKCIGIEGLQDHIEEEIGCSVSLLSICYIVLCFFLFVHIFT